LSFFNAEKQKKEAFFVNIVKMTTFASRLYPNNDGKTPVLLLAWQNGRIACGF